MNQGRERPSYNEIKSYIRLLLQNIKDGRNTGPLESFNSVTREVFIRAYNNNLTEVRKVYEIPNPKEEAIRFRSVWVDVFMACLDYYEKKLIKDGIVISYENERIKINGKNYICDTALEHIALFKQISDELDKLKIKREVTPVISKKSVVVGNTSVYDKSDLSLVPKSTVDSMESVKPVNTLPKGIYPISSVKQEMDINPEYDMSLAYEKMENEMYPSTKKVSKKVPRKVTNYEAYNELKKQRGEIPIVDYDILTKEEIIDLKKNPLVFISGTLNHRIETGFYENCELLKGVATASFIEGKATSPERILKEAIKLIKLSKCTSTDIICYEANNEGLRDAKDDKLFKAFDAMIGLSEILREEGYTPLLSLDNDIIERLRKLEPNYKINVPILSRISSKELDNSRYDQDFIVMDSKNAYDELMLTNNTKKYLNDSKKIKTPSK